METISLSESTNSECEFIEFEPNKWYYILEDYDAPEDAWDWRMNATAYGPFRTEDNANEHLVSNHANPGGATIEEYSPEHAKDEVLVDLIKKARR